MAEGVWRLVYVSRNLLVEDAAARRAGVEGILAASRRDNAAAGVTGALLFNRACFGQALEGPLDAVEETFERIQRDPRHGEVTVLAFEPVSGRGSGAWSMGFAGELPEDRLTFAGVSGPAVAAAGAEGLLALLRGVLHREEQAELARELAR